MAGLDRYAGVSSIPGHVYVCLYLVDTLLLYPTYRGRCISTTSTGLLLYKSEAISDYSKKCHSLGFVRLGVCIARYAPRTRACDSFHWCQGASYLPNTCFFFLFLLRPHLQSRHQPITTQHLLIPLHPFLATFQPRPSISCCYLCVSFTSTSSHACGSCTKSGATPHNVSSPAGSICCSKNMLSCCSPL